MKSDNKSGLSENGNSPSTGATTWLTGSAERKDNASAREGFNRMGHRVAPGLYSIGHPEPESPVFVTANHTLSFDALRSSLKGVNGYILVLDTEGSDFFKVLPEDLPHPFSNRDLAESLGIPVSQSRKITYSLRRIGTITQVGKNRNQMLFARGDLENAML